MISIFDASPYEAAPEEGHERHRDYGALPEHYDVVGACLIWTLHQGLGEQFTADVEAAWVAAYELLAGTMMAAPGEGAPELTAA